MLSMNHLSIFKKLRGYFGYDNLLIGGSYVYTNELNLIWSGKDIDIFILIPRMETWALMNILNSVFDSLVIFDQGDSDKFMENMNQYYKIDGQWKRVIAFKDGVEYDLIFVNDNKTNLIFDNTGSDLSKLYYEVVYDNRLNHLGLHKASRKFLHKLIEEKTCNIYLEQCTDAYASKVRAICEQLKIKVKEWQK